LIIGLLFIISVLKTETPLLFLRNQKIYDAIRVILFLTCLILTFYTIVIPWLICISVIAIIWILSGKIGRNKAFNKYREILKDLAEHEEDEQQKSDYIMESKITNDILQDRVTQSIKLGL
jgi:hypothetical protein